MTSFNDLLNINNINNVDNVDNDYNIDNFNILQINNEYKNKEDNFDKPLFIIDELVPNNKLAYVHSELMKIHYLDNNKVYNPKNTLGEYTLKKHQCTTLYYMIELEKMKFDVKTIKIVKPIYNPYNLNANANVNANANTTEKTIETKIENTNHYTNIGILSDHVGAGKSYCIMALLNESKSLYNNSIPLRNNNIGSSNIKKKKINKLDTNILLVPHSLVGQWNKYLDKSGLKYYVIQKAKDVFGLGDKNCKFNFNNDNDNENNIENDNKNNKNNNNENNENNSNNIKKKTSSKSRSTKSNSKTKHIVSITETEPEPETELETNSKTKKKIILKTKLKKGKIEQDIPEVISEISLEPKLQTYKTLKQIQTDKKKQLELEKQEIYNKMHILRSQIMELQANPDYRYTSTNINERNIIYTKINEINSLLHDLMSKNTEVLNSLKNCGLMSGTITDTQIQSINNYYLTANNYYRREPIDHFQEEFINNLSHINKIYVESLDVILISDSFYNLFSLYMTKDNYTVNRIIIDECNSIKGSNLININSIFTWLITSSINSLMTSNGYIQKQQTHNTGYYYNTREKTIMSTGFIFDTIANLYSNNDNLKLYLINDPEYIKQSILLPEVKTYIIICKDNVVIQVLNGVVSNDIMRMLNAGDIEGIISKLDVIVGDESNLISIITQKYTEDLLIKEYELKVAIENPKYKVEFESPGIINKRTMIKDLKNKITCIEERIKNVDSCPICIDDFTNPIITPCCNNKYCFNCITMAINNKPNCPSCRSNLEISKLLVLSNKKKNGKDGKYTESLTTNSKLTSNITYFEKIEIIKSKSLENTKYENMEKIFELNNDLPIKKYLIFTEYESTLNIKITSILDKWNLKYDRIRGSSTTINKQLEKYRLPNGETNVLLVNSKFFGSGLNLENTTDIIILHKMNNDIEMQAIGRAQRFGREGNLRIWKLYYQNEISL